MGKKLDLRAYMGSLEKRNTIALAVIRIPVRPAQSAGRVSGCYILLIDGTDADYPVF
jgi:hypothetical protein